MDPASLPAGADHDLGGGLLESEMVVGDDQADPGQAPGPERAQQFGPERLVLAVAHGQAEDLPVAVGGDAGGDHHGSVHDPAPDPALEVGGVTEHIGELDMAQGPSPERLHLTVELAADPAHLALGDARRHAQRRDQVVDLASRHPMDVGLDDHCEQRPVDAPPPFQDGREEASRAQLGDLEIDVAGLGRQQPIPAPLRHVVRPWLRS